RDSKNGIAYSTHLPSQGEVEIHRKPWLCSPCPYDLIPPTPVGRTDTPPQNCRMDQLSALARRRAGDAALVERIAFNS
ncbi:MAG: hypothetical protein ACKN9U_20015, partial [Pirellulaceae bacterium]